MYPSGLWKCLAAVVMLIALAAGARASAVIAFGPSRWRSFRCSGLNRGMGLFANHRRRLGVN
jgi:hypothetical protein